ncbi:MAG: DUF4432 family protein [Pseudomonadota bacterium]|nr:DUF4432 family protein [Pseudomonadota bacterium]
MAQRLDDVEITLTRASFGEKEREVARFGPLRASAFRFESGVEALRLAHPRGHVVVLPYLGQIVWSAEFDGVRLAMRSMFAEPRPAHSIIETYGCLAYHSGLLRNGVPGPDDDHALHGEAPCAPMDVCGIACGVDAEGAWIAVTGKREYAMGFGSHYLASPRVVLRQGATAIDIEMNVENLSAAPMDLMYMCHVNFAFERNARIVQAAPFTPEHVVARTAIPPFVKASDRYRAFLSEVAANPARMAVLSEPERYDPEQVFYVKGARADARGRARYLLARAEGDAFEIGWDAALMPHTIRWVLVNSDIEVAAFAMPGTCEPEGYTSEKRKGNVRALAGGAKQSFVTKVGYLDATHAPAVAREIEAMTAR